VAGFIDFSNMAELVSCRHSIPKIDINAPQPIYQDWETEPSESVVRHRAGQRTPRQPRDRAEWHLDFLRHARERFGAPLPTFDEAWYAYRASTICLLMVWLINSSMATRSDQRGQHRTRRSRVLDHDAFRLLSP
jgi:hypothetical protein